MRGRKSFRDALIDAKRGNDFYADLAQKPRMPVTDVFGNQLIKPARKRERKPTGNLLERDVLAEVKDALRKHPRVASVWRIVPGEFIAGKAHVITAPSGFPDLSGMLTNGKFYGCEVKRPGGKLSPHQAEFLATIRANNGIAFVAYGAADVEFNLR